MLNAKFGFRLVLRLGMTFVFKK